MLSDAARGSDIRYRAMRYGERGQGESGDAYARPLKEHSKGKMARVIPRPRREDVRVRTGQGGDQAAAVDALQSCARDEDFEGRADTVVDISAMPPDAYFPALKIPGRARYAASAARAASAEAGPRSGGAGPVPSVCAMAPENAGMDSAIAPMGPGEQGEYMHALSGGLQIESQRHRPKVRIVALGSGRAARHRLPTRHKAASHLSPLPSTLPSSPSGARGTRGRPSTWVNAGDRACLPSPAHLLLVERGLRSAI